MSFHYCWIVIKSFYDSQANYLSECGEITVMAPSRQTLESDDIFNSFLFNFNTLLARKRLKRSLLWLGDRDKSLN